jgi:Fe2+ or Zn2+ uptake regulation protein
MRNAHNCKDELHAAGSRATPGRLGVLKLLESERKPLTVAAIEKKLGNLNQVTIYRILDTLVAAGLVRRGMSGRTARFEYAGKPHHHHLVCADCDFVQACRTC